MAKNIVPITVGVLLVAVLVLYNMTYTVSYDEVAIRTHLGETREVTSEPGLHFKAPFFIDRIIRFDRRLQLTDSAMTTVATRDGQQVMPQAYVLWRIASDDAGVLAFRQGYESVEEAAKVLEQQLTTALGVVGGFQFAELVGPGNRLVDAEARVMEELRRTLPGGIEAVSVGLTQVALPPKASQAVIRRMIATQERLAETERSRGSAEAQLIQSRAATDADKIRSFAEQRASEIEAEGTRAAARYLEQMRDGQQLAIFLAWCDALRDSLSGKTTIILDTTRAPFHLMELDAPVDAQGVPIPAAPFGAAAPAPRAGDEVR